MNGVGRLQFRPRFKVVAKENEGDDEGSTVKEDMVGLAHKPGQEGQNGG